MSRSSQVRAAAARCVHGVLQGRSLEQLLDELMPPTQQSFFKALVFESVRWQPRTRWIETRLLDKPIRSADSVVSALICVALTEILKMDKPGHVVVSESVNAVRDLGRPRMAGLVNGLLREFLRQRDDIEARLQHDPVARDAHPAWWRECFARDWPALADAIIAEGNRQGPMWLRVNRTRTSVDDYLGQLEKAGIAAQAHDIAKDALLLGKARPVDELPGFAAGLVSVQDAAAQLAAILLAPQPGDRVLDLCAAPGSKTCHLLETAGGRLDVLALDIDRQRLARVGENLDRLGLAARLVCADARDTRSWWDGQPFDRILLDVPCSGSGVIRRHPDIKLLRRPADIEQNKRLQEDLLATAWTVLAEGATLLYCSCSVLKTENQARIIAFVSNQPDAELAPLSDSLMDRFGKDRAPGLQIFPGEQGMDGFYYAVLKKKTGSGKRR